MVNKYFLEVFESVPRQGPGSDEETKKAYSFLETLPTRPNILDIGCGKGKQTIALSKLSDGHIIAMDMHKAFLSSLQKSVFKRDLQDRITCLLADMGEIPFLENEFDLVWAEGSAFIIGYQQALSKWKKYIKPGGYLAFSDCVWLKSNPPKELTDFWKGEDYVLPTVDEVLQHSRIEGYTELNHFTISINSWTSEFYDYIEKELDLVKDKYKGNVEAQDTFFAIEEEIRIFNQFNEYFGYVFFVFQK